MATLVIKSFPDMLHSRLKQTAAVHRRSVNQETIYLIETALAAEAATPAKSNWANRKLHPDYEAALKSGALVSTVDSSVGLSEERDAR